MIITSKVKKRWKFLFQHGDFAAIGKLMPKYDYRKVSGAFKSTNCPIDVFNAIEAFYDEREKTLPKNIKVPQDQD